MQIPVEAIGHIGQVARNGSPLLLNSMGRIFGLGDDEQKALARGDFPRWAVLLIGIGAGVAAGVYVQRKWPSQVSKVVGE